MLHACDGHRICIATFALNLTAQNSGVGVSCVIYERTLKYVYASVMSVVNCWQNKNIWKADSSVVPILTSSRLCYVPDVRNVY